MTRALILALLLAACAPDIGETGCWEDMGGRMTYRAGWAPKVNGLCPTPAETARFADMERAMETDCRLSLARIACTVHALRVGGP